MCGMKAVASTRPIPKSDYPKRVLRKGHLAILGVKHLRSLVGHGLAEIEAVVSTTLIPQSGSPLEELI